MVRSKLKEKILLIVIFIGVLFDLVAIAVTVAKEEEFHAKASKKIKGAKTALKSIKHSFCINIVFLYF